MKVLTYINSLFSVKKIVYKHVALTALWDNSTYFTPYTHVLQGSRLFKVTIGRYSRVGKHTQITNATIGNFTAIGSECIIGLGQHPTDYLSCHSIFYKKGNWGWHDDWVSYPDDFIENKHIIIGNDVWIGRRSMIMDGITIGDGSIIASGAVVTKDVEPYSIVGGVPAKVLKFRFSKEMIELLEKIQWWNYSDNELTSRIELFHIKNPSLVDLKTFFG